MFEAAIEAGAERICYASSVAAYGFHSDNPDWLTEDVPGPRQPRDYYSQQKAEVEGVLAQLLLKTLAHERLGVPAVHRRRRRARRC